VISGKNRLVKLLNKLKVVIVVVVAVDGIVEFNVPLDTVYAVAVEVVVTAVAERVASLFRN